MTAKVDSTLSKGLFVIEALAQCPKGIGVSELARNLSLTKSNTFRLLHTLMTHDYVRQDEQKRYFATMKAWKLGQMIMENLDLPRICKDQMEYLSSETGEAIYLSVLDGLSTLYIEKIESTQAIRAYTPKGGHAPLHCVATGKTLLAFNYDALRNQIIENLARFTEKTITTAEKLDAEMEIIRKQGVAIDLGEYRKDVYSIAAPIFSSDNKIIASIGISTPAINVKQDKGIESLAQLTKFSAQQISRLLKDI